MIESLRAKKILPNKKQKRHSTRRVKGGRASGRRKGDAATGWSSALGPMSASTSTQGFVVRSMPLFGFRTRRTIQYFADVAIAGTGTPGTQVFSANGCFDPDITGTGGQPMGFDQMMLFYNHYTVMRSRIRAVFQNLTTGGVIATCVLSVSGSSTPVTVVEDLIENGDCSIESMGFTGGYSGGCTQRRTLDVGKYQGLRNTIDDPDMRGDSASNPVEQVYYHLSLYDPVGAGAVSALVQCLIEYDTIFHEPRKGPLS
jgi:hypothetical protein